jgi:hypothetical protein
VYLAKAYTSFIFATTEVFKNLFGDSQEIKLSAQSDLRHQVSLIVHPMQQVNTPYSIFYHGSGDRLDGMGHFPFSYFFDCCLLNLTED